MNEANTTIGQRLRQLRLWRGKTQTELADLAGFTTAAISMWETGRRPLDRRSNIAALAAALKVSETELTGGPHLSADRLQSAPHAAIPALRLSLTANMLGQPAADSTRPLTDIVTELESLRPAHAAGDYVTLGGHLPKLLDELYAHAARGNADQVRAVQALAQACGWSASVCHCLRYDDLAQLAARNAMEAANFIGDPVARGKAEFERVGTAPREWTNTLAMAEKAASALEPHVRDQHSMQVLGMLTLRAALAAASALRPDTAVHWLNEAAAIAGRVADDPPRNWEFFGATNVAIWRVSIGVENGESGGKVLELVRGADASKLVIPTRRAAFYSDVGCGLARDPRTRGDAVRWLRQAETAAPQWIRNRAVVRETVAYLLDRAVASAGRELRGMAARMGLPH